MSDQSARAEIDANLTELLGRGGYASVFAGPDFDGVPSAVKIAHRADTIARARLEREAEALRAIGPPSVPALFDSGVLDDGRAFLVMERIALPTLAERIAEEDGLFALDWIRTTCLAILDSLSHAHVRDVVHRDLKPQNVFVDEPAGRARLIDFGVARMRESVGVELTGVGEALGTPLYMAPEQIRGGDIDHRADIYSFGVVLYQLLTGTLPFSGERAQLERGHLLLRPPPPSRYRELPESLESLVLRCLSKFPEARPRDVLELRAALDKAFTGKKTVTTQSAAPKTERRRSQRQLVGLLFIGGGLELYDIERILQHHEGVVASQRASGLVCVFRGGAREPLASARSAADALLEAGAVATVVHLAEVRSRLRRSGQLSYSGIAIDEPERWLPSSPSGLVLTDAAAAAIQEVPETSLIGRDELVASMRDGIASAGSDRSPVFFTALGARGMGKTRLATALQSVISAPVRLSLHRGAAGQGAYQVSASLLRSLITVPASVPDDIPELVERELGVACTAESWKAIAVALAWRSAAELQLSHQQTRRSLIQSLSGLIRRAAEKTTLAIAIDNAHLADDAALDALAYAGVQGGSCSLWVGLFADPGFSTARPHWGVRVNHEIATLAALSESEACQLAAELLAPVQNPPVTLLQRLADWTEGNPQRLVDLAGALRREGIVRRHPGTESWYIASDELERLPRTSSEAWLAQRDVERLPGDLARLLQIASVIGDEVEIETIDAVLTRLERDQDSELFADAAAGLAQLEAREILGASGVGRFRFRQRSRREAIERQVDESERARLHEHAYQFFSSRGDAPFRLVSLAHHAEASGREREAVDAYLALAHRAIDEYRYLDAEQLYSAVIRLLERSESDTHHRLLRERGEVRRHLTHYEEALRDLQAAQALATERHDTPEVVAALVAQAAVFDFTDRFADSATAAETAWAMAPPGLPVVLSARLHNWLGVARHRQQRYQEAVGVLRTAVALGEAVDDHESVVGSSMMLAAALRNQHQLEEGHRIIDDVIARCERAGDFFHLTISLCNRINFWRLRNAYEPAISDLERAMELAQEMGYDEMEMYGRAELSTLLLHTGKRREALEHSRIGHEISTRRYRDNPAVVASYIYGQQLAHNGSFDEARVIFSQIAKTTVGDNAWLGVGIESVGMAIDPHSDAEWDAFIARARAALSEPELVEMIWLRGRSAHFHGDRRSAVAALRTARDEALEQAPAMVAPIERDLHLLESSS